MYEILVKYQPKVEPVANNTSFTSLIPGAVVQSNTNIVWDQNKSGLGLQF